MMMLGICGFLRYIDLVKVFLDEIRFYDEYMELFLETYTNDVLRFGNITIIVEGEGLVCPLYWVNWLIGHRKLQGHIPLFRRYDGRVAKLNRPRCRTHMGMLREGRKLRCHIIGAKPLC